MPTFLLFDIDGTLLDTGGAGGASILDAAEAMFACSRRDLPPLMLAGATDGGVLRDLFSAVGKALTTEARAEFLQLYLGFLKRRLHAEDFAGRLLDGVPELLAQLSRDSQVHLGLLTGNVRAAAQLKLERFGIHPFFADGAFGDDADDRNHLGPFALRRMAQACGHELHPDEVILIGDTPKDIACAKAIGARCLAVATGQFSRSELELHAPWRCLENLADLNESTSLLSKNSMIR